MILCLYLQFHDALKQQDVQLVNVTKICYSNNIGEMWKGDLEREKGREGEDYLYL